jgi:hypothetical protein
LPVVTIRHLASGTHLDQTWPQAPIVPKASPDSAGSSNLRRTSNRRVIRSVSSFREVVP